MCQWFKKVRFYASYADDELEIKRRFFDHQKKKNFASMQNRIDSDIEKRIPPNRIVSKLSSKGEMMDFHSISEPIDQAFVLLSVMKLVVGLSKNKHSITATLVPWTPLTKKLYGFETKDCEEAVKYSVTNKEGMRWCNGSWDNVLGRKWDLIPCYSSDGEDVLIKTMRFTEHRDFGMFRICVQTLTTLHCWIRVTTKRATYIETSPRKFLHQRQIRHFKKVQMMFKNIVKNVLYVYSGSHSITFDRNLWESIFKVIQCVRTASNYWLTHNWNQYDIDPSFETFDSASYQCLTHI